MGARTGSCDCDSGWIGWIGWGQLGSAGVVNRAQKRSAQHSVVIEASVHQGAAPVGAGHAYDQGVRLPDLRVDRGEIVATRGEHPVKVILPVIKAAVPVGRNWRARLSNLLGGGRNPRAMSSTSAPFFAGVCSSILTMFASSVPGRPAVNGRAMTSARSLEALRGSVASIGPIVPHLTRWAAADLMQVTGWGLRCDGFGTSCSSPEAAATCSP